MNGRLLLSITSLMWLFSGQLYAQSFVGGISSGCSFQDAKDGRCEERVILDNGCPEGYYVSGDYCIAEDSTLEPQEIPRAVCPEGFDQLGSRCARADNPG